MSDRHKIIGRWMCWTLVFAAGCAPSAQHQISLGPQAARRFGGAEVAVAEDVPDLVSPSAPQGLVKTADAQTELTTDPAPAAGPLSLDRKIIYTANLAIEVERFDALPEAITRLAEQFGGYIATTSVSQLQGNRRSGAWMIRVPVDRYREFLRSASGLGIPQSLRENAQDVSEQFVDLEARIESGKKLEAQIMQLLEKQSEKIDDLLAVERELARVRLEIEQMEGRLRLLANQVSLSTVHLTAQEKLTYLTPEQPSLGRRAALEWSEAVGRFGRFLENSLVAAIANTFVILAWCLLGLGGWLVFRAVRRRKVPVGPAEVGTIQA